MNAKPSFGLRGLAVAVATSLVVDPIAFAQQPPPQRTAAEVSAGQTKPSGKTFSQQDLDELMAPIALYPDALLAQVLMASTYPLEIVEAARWQKANASLKDKALEDALREAVVGPEREVARHRAAGPHDDEREARLDHQARRCLPRQQEDVLKTAQALRKKADEAGNLKTPRR
jgi:hypothetical protein